MGRSLDSSIYVTSLPAISSIAPNSGSIYGGTLVKINGNGFSANTSVKFDSADCKIIQLSLSSITCMTSAHAAQNTNSIIK